MSNSHDVEIVFQARNGAGPYGLSCATHEVSRTHSSGRRRRIRVLFGAAWWCIRPLRDGIQRASSEIVPK
jgi:hypothetical protein